MDSNGLLLSQLLHKTITPVVMVLPTPLVEEACRKNNLNFVQMLKPFCSFNNIDVPVRTASDQPYRLQKFKIRMFYASEIQQMPYEFADDHLKETVENATEKAFSELQENPQQIEAVQKMINSESLSSWIQVYNQEFIRTLSFSDHEAFDHPIACLLAVSSKDENPVNKFVDLFNTDQLPSLFSDGAMDPKILKHFVLVHDNEDETADKANEILLEMKKTFGNDECKLIHINSSQMDGNYLSEDIWHHFDTSYLLKNPSLDSKHGQYLNKDDIEGLYHFMQDFVGKNIIPYMEQKIRSLNQHVSATRKGFKNQIKNLWWRKGKEESNDINNGTTYSFNSIESQIRVLGDYAFILHDYELALSNYRLLSTDYKLDKAWKRFAGAQEMTGLSLFMMDQSRKEAEYAMETAFTTYQKIGTPGQRNAARCAIWWAEMHKARGQFKEAAVVYNRASSEEPSLRAALLLEQAAYCYLRINPPMLRKYAFHLILSGNRYNISGMWKHALRVYTSALPVFDFEGWEYIKDHINFSLGRWYAQLGNPEKAIQFLVELLACTHQSAATQEVCLADFLQIFQNLGTKDELPQLRLPVINMSSLRVHFEDHRTYASHESSLIPEKTWQTLEEGLAPSTQMTTTNWLDSASKSSSKHRRKTDFKICISGEPVTVALEFKNPLQIPIDISCVSLICDFSSDTSSVKEGLCDNMMIKPESDDSDQANRLISEDRTVLQQDPDAFIVSNGTFNLKGGQSMTVNLKVTPRKEGILHIIGVRWMLSRTVTGRFDFAFESQKKRSHKKNQDSIEHLTFHVYKLLPRVVGTVHRMPMKAHVGEIHRLVLELSNQSDKSIKNIKLKINNPRFLMVGEPGDLDSEFPSCLEAKKDDGVKKISTEGDLSNHTSNDDGSIFIFPKDTIIEGTSTFLWPLWLHACETSTMSFCMSIYYEMEEPSETMHYRLLRMSHTFQVSQSLDLSVQINPWTSSLEEFLLQLQIQNQSNENFWLRQVSALGSFWKISSLQPSLLSFSTIDGESNDYTTNSAFLSASVCPSQLLPAREVTTLFFKLTDIRTYQTHASSDTFTCNLQNSSDLQLGPPSSTEPLFDVSSGPIFKFHLEERKAHKEASTKSLRETSLFSGVLPAKSQEFQTVDLILVAEQQDDSINDKFGNISDSQKLSSHHLCHVSVKNNSPLRWMMDGPKLVNHDFSSHPICTVKLALTVKNCSNVTLSVQLDTSDSCSLINEPSDTTQLSTPPNRSGWYDINLENDEAGKVKTDSGNNFSTAMSETKSYDSQTLLPSLPFKWCELTSAYIEKLQAQSSVTIPLSVIVFAPGVYDLSRYKLQWKVNENINHLDSQLDALAQDSTVAADSVKNSNKFSRSSSSIKETTSGVALGHLFHLMVI